MPYTNELSIRKEVREAFMKHPCDFHKERAETIGEYPDFDSRDWGNNAYDFPAPSGEELPQLTLEEEVEVWNKIEQSNLI